MRGSTFVRWPAELARRIESLEVTVSEQAAALASEKLRVAALEKEALKALAFRLLPPVPPAPLSSPAGSS